MSEHLLTNSYPHSHLNSYITLRQISQINHFVPLRYEVVIEVRSTKYKVRSKKIEDKKIEDGDEVFTSSDKMPKSSLDNSGSL